jgi:hypothetical protein
VEQACGFFSEQEWWRGFPTGLSNWINLGHGSGVGATGAVGAAWAVEQACGFFSEQEWWRGFPTGLSNWINLGHGSGAMFLGSTRINLGRGMEARPWAFEPATAVARFFKRGRSRGHQGSLA